MIELEPMEDARGFFARVWCRDEFAAHGISMDIAQASLSHSPMAGTVRGLHFQRLPSREGKVVRCERGRIHDVIVDLRPGAPSFARHFALELDSLRHNALYVPPGCAHGFQTLAPDSDVIYLTSEAYRPDLAEGVRYDDPAFAIKWPLPVSCIMARDRDYPDFDPAAYVKMYPPSSDS